MRKNHLLHLFTLSPHHLVIAALAAAGITARAETLSITIPPPHATGPEHFMGKGPGSATAPDAATSKIYGTIGYDNDSLLRDGKPFIPVMGEFHYSRYPRAEWRDELLKMKAGGITIISTYVFWIHHEEIQGQFDWSGDKDLHAFVQLCGELGLPILVRIGPWCHGEVRNGGHPDWVEALAHKRRLDPDYMAAVAPLYKEIAAQLKGLLWKDGGPIIGIQLENEFGGDPAYLLALKNMARDDGLDVPLYTKTGWPAAKVPVPFGEMLPYFSTYAEGFWDRTLDSMPQEKYWQAFSFNADRIDTAVASDIFGTAAPGTHVDESDAITYPYLTCEVGTGMIPSYHRRILMNTMDTYAVALCKIGSGVNLPGYYLYHGGTNPDSKTGYPLSESQATKMWNDMPNKTYDWDGPVGEFGQVRESYNYLRRLHLFLADYGETLARMPATFPSAIKEKTDNKIVRWSVRSDGKSGYLFVNNYQRALDEPAKPDTQFQIKLAQSTITIPEYHSLAVPANTSFFMPINLDLGGVTLRYATAQPICKLQTGRTTSTFFARIKGIDPEFVFDRGTVPLDGVNGETTIGKDGDTIAFNPRMMDTLIPFFQMKTADNRFQSVYLLNEEQSLQTWKGKLIGTDRVFVVPQGDIVLDDQKLKINFTDRLNVLAYPPLIPGTDIVALWPELPRNGLDRNGSFGGIAANKSLVAIHAATFDQTQQPGPVREIKMGSQKVAEQPVDADFAGPQPAVFKIKLPANYATLKDTKVLMRINFTGDVARLYLGDKMIEDNFYNSLPMDYGLWRLPPNTTELTFKILPLQKTAPIMLEKWPDMKGKDSIAEVQGIDLIPEQTVTLEAK